MILQSAQKPLRRHAQGSGRGHLEKGVVIVNLLSLWRVCKSEQDLTVPEAAQQGPHGVVSLLRWAVFCVRGVKHESPAGTLLGAGAGSDAGQEDSCLGKLLWHPSRLLGCACCTRISLGSLSPFFLRNMSGNRCKFKFNLFTSHCIFHAQDPSQAVLS